MRARSTSMAPLALLGVLSGCASYECADILVLGYPLREQCGPFGSFGYHYFEDEMVQLLLDASFEDFLTEESAFVSEYLPGFTLTFHDSHLMDGELVSSPNVRAQCHRTAGIGTGIFFWWADDAEVQVLGPATATKTGGKSYRIRWRASCVEADMYTEGEDVIELNVEGTGYRFDLWGTPADFPETW